jgi:hypothetical protein
MLSSMLSSTQWMISSLPMARITALRIIFVSNWIFFTLMSPPHAGHRHLSHQRFAPRFPDLAPSHASASERRVAEEPVGEDTIRESARIS